MTARQREILLVEDNPGDVRLTAEALKEAAVRVKLQVVQDGHEALDYLTRQGAYAHVRRPDLVLLDLNLPKKDGRYVLEEIKKNEQLRRIPVVVMSSSTAPDDVQAVYDLHGNCYIAKPMDLDGFIEAIGVINRFWLSTVTLAEPAEA